MNVNKDESYAYRRDPFESDKINLLKRDEANKLQLRKKFVDDYLETTRKNEMLKKRKPKEIDISKLDVPEEYKNFNISDMVTKHNNINPKNLLLEK